MTARSIFDALDNSPVPSPTSWPARQSPLTHGRPSPAREAARSALQAQANRTTEATIETRAQYFAADPKRLDLIEAGLSLWSPKMAKARIAALIDVELGMRRRFGGEVPLMNLKGAARFLERFSSSGDAP